MGFFFDCLKEQFGILVFDKVTCLSPNNEYFL
jgi:hypothetical protein